MSSSFPLAQTAVAFSARGDRSCRSRRTRWCASPRRASSARTRAAQSRSCWKQKATSSKADKPFLTASPARLRWNGRHNLYVGSEVLRAGGGRQMVLGRSGRLEETLGRAGGRLPPDRTPLLPARCSGEASGGRSAPAGKSSGHGDAQRVPAAAQVGPDWDLVGPGEAYVRALAAEKAEASRQRKRPEAAHPLPAWTGFARSLCPADRSS